MKLPRLSNPKVQKFEHIEITSASHFDLMSTWGQYAFVAVCVLPFPIIFILVKMGYLK